MSPGEQGSRFWFALELPSVPAAELPDLATQVVGAIAGYSGPRKSILVADDIAENRAMLEDMLVPLGFRLFEACNGEECLEMAPSLQPDLILMDIVMPELGGLDAIRSLRQVPSCRDIPVIAVSASASTDDANVCRSAGADAFIPKPVDFEKLLASIGTLLDLCWIYKLPGSRNAVAQEAAVESFGLPPASEMLLLLQLAKLGNMQDILAWADRIAAADANCQRFVTQLRELAVNYQSKAILQLAERHAEGWRPINRGVDRPVWQEPSVRSSQPLDAHSGQRQRQVLGTPAHRLADFVHTVLRYSRRWDRDG